MATVCELQMQKAHSLLLLKKQTCSLIVNVRYGAFRLCLRL